MRVRGLPPRPSPAARFHWATIAPQPWWSGRSWRREGYCQRRTLY